MNQSAGVKNTVFPPCHINAGGNDGRVRLALIETARGTEELAASSMTPSTSTRACDGPDGTARRRQVDAHERAAGRLAGRGESVAMIAVDPSSRVSGGALLGDRARIVSNPKIRTSSFVQWRHATGSADLSDETIAAVALLRALYDRVLVESVGIGQSEADIVLVADTVVLCIQPASGDSLQFMKAGVMELPDVVAVTKADLGAAASRARSEAESALTLFSRESGMAAAGRAGIRVAR